MSNRFWHELSQALFGTATDPYNVSGSGHLPSVYHVSDFAEACVGLAGVALARAAGRGGTSVEVDRRLASLWFDMTVTSDGWDVPSAWDAIAGVYQCSDGWIRLHTNAPHHRNAALHVLNVAADKEQVSKAVATWAAAELESAVVAAHGCAAELRSSASWAEHPQGKSVAAEPLVHWSDRGTCVPMPLNADAPLKGIKILDLTRVLAGPVASRFLAGYGAEVLRIDPPDWNEPACELEVTLGKRCAGLDLKAEEDRAVLTALMAEADVLLHGYRADALEGLGFGEEQRHHINPTLIDVSLNAYGWSGPWRNRRGFDSLVQMSCGIAARGQQQTGADHPVPLPVQALDHGTGYMLAAAVLDALHQRSQGRIRSARLSLARTAQVLMQHPCDLDTSESIALRESDLSQKVEHTDWGPGRRVIAPLRVDGHLPDWSIPAGHLRRHPPHWVG